MRLDKFLKVSRLIKRRTIAKEICDAGKIMINGRTAKASSEVVVGDTLELRFANRIMQVKIAKVSETVKTQEAAEMYEILSEERIVDDLA
ncbi:MAG: RNA-binding S4 domain-containing protein [Peptococcaceae bacterium]|nr:RNA-binding S4 domain-containing protein [Peptococcaceae bacterium]